VEPGRILIVDDDPRYAKSLAQVLMAAGHTVADLVVGDQVLDVLERDPACDVILLDLNMPGVTGYEVLDEVNALPAPPKVIVVSGEDRDDQLRRLLKLGAFDYLSKPCEPDDLLRSIDDAIAARRRDAEALEVLGRINESNRLYHFLVDQSPDVIYTLDADGCFTFASSSAAAIFGHAPEALRNAHWTTLFSEAEQERANRRFNERRTGHRATRNLELKLADPGETEVRWIQVSATGLYTRDDEDELTFEGTYGIARDITAGRLRDETRVRLEMQLEQARRMAAIGQLAGGIAHDFNNILASMIGYAELARMSLEGRPEEPGGAYLEEVVSAGQRARDLIAQLLNFSRSDGGNPRVVRLDQEIDGVMRMLRAVIPTSIRLDRDIDPSIQPVWIDPAHLQQVILNLFINARNAVDRNGLIRVHLSRLPTMEPHVCAACGARFEGDHTLLEVTDDGCGIPAGRLRRLFDPIVTTSTEGRGTGFGLSIIKGIVHRYGGHLDVVSEVGQGTSFRIYFPPQTMPEAPREERPRVDECLPHESHASRSGHVVVVDDEVSVANFLQELLEHAGYRTTVFNDPGTALEYLQASARDVDLLITDQTMPRLTGTDLARQLSTIDGAPPVILCTGYGQDLGEARDSGVVAVLAKPFAVQDMLGQVARTLASGHASEQALRAN
jgi:PAS domain S-box-containing protein